MDKAFKDNIRPLLDLAEKLTPLLKGTNIKLPRIASCGMQSHGKSSTLESITHISLPKGDGTVTICPIKISLRNSDKEYARIKFEFESESKYKTIKLNEISDKIIEYQNEAKKMHAVETEVKKEEIKLFDEVIQVEVNRKNAPNLTLYDLPGLNFKESIKEQSAMINEKYLKEEETTVLLVLSGEEEITNAYTIEWMKKIPNYQKRFNPIITKADRINKKIELYLDEINSWGLQNNPALIINKAGDNSTLSYDEMAEKEIAMINQINNINKYPNIYKGINELINHLIELQRKDLAKAFSDLMSRINEEISLNEEAINKLPKECKDQREFFIMFEECIKKFSKILEKKMEILNCNEEGKPKENLMKYHIHLKFKEHIEKTKIKMSELFTESFCNEVTNNIIQFNADNISILEDTVAFNTLIKQKIIDAFIFFEPTILDIYDYMNSQIIPLIDNAFGDFYNLKIKVVKIFSDYADEQRKKVQDIFKELYYLETENVLTYNSDLINKVNCLNKHINFYLLGKKLKRHERDKEDHSKKNAEKNENNSVKKKIALEEDIVDNDVGQAVKNTFEEKSKIINSLIEIVSNFDNESIARYFDSNEYTGRIKIAYKPEDIATYDEKIINPDHEKFYDENKYEFIPGFQYIEKNKLDEFKKLIKEGKIQIKTANVITKMVTYMEIMLNRVLDTLFLTIKKYLYNKLTDADMINHIKNEIHLINFAESKNIMEISSEITNKRKQFKDNLKKFKEAKILVSKLNDNKDINLIKESLS
jgi:hypothetical protein